MAFFVLSLLVAREAAGFAQSPGGRRGPVVLAAAPGDSSEMESLLEEVATLREEISAAETELQARPARASEPRTKCTGAPLSVRRCMTVYTATSGALPAGVELAGERASFASAMRFEYLTPEHKAMELLVTVAAGEDEGLFAESAARFAAWGVFADIIGADDFSPCDELGSYLGRDPRTGKKYEQSDTDAVGRFLWRRWLRVAAARSRLRREGELRRRLEKFEKLSDFRLFEGTYERKLGHIVDVAAPAATPAGRLERALCDMADTGWPRLEFDYVVDDETLVKRDQEAWDLLHFASRGLRARACAIGLALDAVMRGDARVERPLARALTRERFDTVRSLLPKTADPNVEDLIAATRRIEVSKFASKATNELLSTFVVVFVVVAALNLVPDADSDAALAEQRVLDPILFGSTDNLLDKVAAYDLKHGTDFLSLPHVPTEKYPDRGRLPDPDQMRDQWFPARRQPTLDRSLDSFDR